VIFIDQYTPKNEDTLTRRVIITKFSKSELKTKLILIRNFGIRFKLWTESFGSAKD